MSINLTLTTNDYMTMKIVLKCSKMHVLVIISSSWQTMTVEACLGEGVSQAYSGSSTTRSSPAENILKNIFK